jgi:hypothetical protein
MNILVLGATGEARSGTAPAEAMGRLDAALAARNSTRPDVASGEPLE